jgi:hypothetical protein
MSREPEVWQAPLRRERKRKRGWELSMIEVEVERGSYQMPPRVGISITHFLTVADINRSVDPSNDRLDFLSPRGVNGFAQAGLKFAKRSCMRSRGTGWR